MIDETEDFNPTAGRPPPSGSRLVASYNLAGPYEVDEGEVYLLSDNRFYFRWASGCSCWDGEFDSEVHDSWIACRRFGMGQRFENFTFEPEFESLKAIE